MMIGQESTELLKVFLPKVCLPMLLYGESQRLWDSEARGSSGPGAISMSGPASHAECSPESVEVCHKTIGQVSAELLKFFLPKVCLPMLLYGETLKAFWCPIAEAPMPRRHVKSPICHWSWVGDAPSTFPPLEMLGIPLVVELRGCKRDTRRPEQ